MNRTLKRILNASVEREAHQNAKLPKEQRGSAFLEKTDTQLAHSSYFIKKHTSLIGAGKGSNYQSHLALAKRESRQPTQISLPFDYGET